MRSWANSSTNTTSGVFASAGEPRAHVTTEVEKHQVTHGGLGSVGGAGDWRVAVAATHRSGLPGDHRLVHAGRALHDAPIRGNASAGAHHHDIPARISMIQNDCRN
ncbi:hypothetical protein A9Z40_12065 [Microbacterium arborescens]|uniref:Uncharacterized protein n=1 Tax=Microbacterium arborescens TaxID=33883 RepID=A0ABX2WNF6_9MICO|nr:hypothetical protein A9Z40_12065 [Microbacterium arborescens]